MAQRIYWSEEETTMLRKMADAGCTMDEVLRVFRGRTIEGISGKLNRLGIELKPQKSEVDYEAFKQLIGGRQKCL